MDLGDEPECTREGVLKKSWKFYRRTGAIWTDGYHLPAHQRRWSERADLDAQHAAYVRRRKQQEAQAERDRKAEIKQRAKKIRSRLHLRQVENAERFGDAWSPAEARAARSTSSDVIKASDTMLEERRARRADLARTILAEKRSRAPQRVHKLKTRDYYHGDDFLWGEMTHVPHERLHLVIDERIVDKDREALERIDRRLEEEVQEQLNRACAAQTKIDKQREHFRAQQRRNDRRASSMGLNVPRRVYFAAETSAPATVPQDGGTQARNQMEEVATSLRAVPRLLGRPASGKGAQVSDKSGLLHVDPVASRRLEHFWALTGSAPKRVGAPRPSSAHARPRSKSASESTQAAEASRHVFFAAVPPESAEVAPGGSDSIVFASQLETDALDGDEGMGDEQPPSELASGVLCKSLSAPAAVLLEIQEFEGRLQVLEANGETAKPFWMET